MDNMENQEVVETKQEEVAENIEQQTESESTLNELNQGESAPQQAANAEEPVLEEWQKDGRYGKRWKTADDMYKSYRSIEDLYNDVNPKYTKLMSLLKDNGFQAETLADELKKYADYRDPNSRINQIYNYIDGFLKNDIYSTRVQQFFEQLEQEELQRLYPNMNAEQIAKQQAMDKELQELKRREAERQSQAEYQKEIDGINKGFAECEELAKEYGFKITQEVKNYLFTHCGKNNIDPKYLKSEFINLYGKQLREARDAKILANYNARKEKIKSAQIISGGAGKVGNMAQVPKGKASLKAGLEKLFGR